MSESLIAQDERRCRVLNTLDMFGCLHTSEVADKAEIPLATVRLDLHALEEAGRVVGVMHDERGLFADGRKLGAYTRTYWSLVGAES